MKKFLIIVMALIGTVTFTACSGLIGADSSKMITGNVTYKERIALPENAKVTVTLSDVSKMDVAAEVISRHSFLTEGAQVPLSYTLRYEPSEINPSHTYAVSARIEVDGKLMFINDTAHHVLTDPAKTLVTDIMVRSVGR